MRVKVKHVGRVCRCTRCRGPIFVTHDRVTPPIKLFDRNGPRYFEAEDVPVHWQKGDRFMGQYEVLDCLGKGGMGVVHLVHNKSWGVDVAVKTPMPRLLQRESAIVEFEREAEYWVGMSTHPNIVYCYYVKRMGGIPRIFMEYVPGGHLSSYIAEGVMYEGGPEEALRKTLEVAMQMAQGLRFAHEQGIVHQDVKPPNTLVAPSGRVKITDFGLVRALSLNPGDDEGEPELRRVLGTPPYSSPEQFGTMPVTHKADMWGWSASVVEMLMGKVSWQNCRVLTEALDHYLAPKKESGNLPVVPDGLSSLIRDCFREFPEDRPADMAEVADRVRDVYEEFFGEACPYGSAEAEVAAAETLNNRAVSLSDLGKSDQAVELWTSALEQQPEHLESSYNLGLHKWHSGEQTDGDVVRLLMEACKTLRGAWLPRYLLGCVLIERGDHPVAIEVLDSIGEPDASRREVLMASAIARRDADLATAEMTTVRAHDAAISCVHVSRDGSHAVSGDDTGLFKVWKIGEDITCMGCFNSVPARSIAISRDNQFIFLGCWDGRLDVWDASKLRCLRTIAAHEKGILSVCPDRTGETVITASEDRGIRVWELARGKQVMALDGHIRAVNALDISKCGRYLLSGGSDTQVMLWNLSSGACLKKLRGHEHRIFSVAISPDGETGYSSGRDGLIYVWNLKDGTETRRFHAHVTEGYSLSLNEDTGYLLSGSRIGSTRLWNLERGYCVRSFPGSAPCWVSRRGSIAVSADHEPGVIRFWRLPSMPNRYVAPYVFSRAI